MLWIKSMSFTFLKTRCQPTGTTSWPTSQSLCFGYSPRNFIKIPDEAYGTYMRLPRPAPLLRAKRLEKHLNTTAQICYKCEYDSGLL